MYAHHAIPAPDVTGFSASVSQELRDPREDGSLCARLQVAEEMVAKLRSRICRLADNVQCVAQGKTPEQPYEPHMNLLAFPSEIIADAKAAESALNRIEGALGV